MPRPGEVEEMIQQRLEERSLAVERKTLDEERALACGLLPSERSPCACALYWFPFQLNAPLGCSPTHISIGKVGSDGCHVRGRFEPALGLGY